MKSQEARVFIGLGSNLDDPQAQVLAAVDEIAALPGVRLCACSSLYVSAPVGFAAQPDFVNAVVEAATALPPLALLDALQGIERRHGRIRAFANSPRTLDLDLLIYGDLELQTAALVLPHPRVHLRAFVLRPLHEIAPDCVIPGLGPARDWLPRCAEQQASRLELPAPFRRSQRAP